MGVEVTTNTSDALGITRYFSFSTTGLYTFPKTISPHCCFLGEFGCSTGASDTTSSTSGAYLVIFIEKCHERTLKTSRWEIAIAALRSGIIICPATTLLVAKDIEYRCQETRATVFVGDSISVQKFQRVKSKCPSIKNVIQFDESTSHTENSVTDLNAGLKHIPENVRFEGPKTLSRDPALIFFTSGTSGPPKMVLHNHISYPLGLICAVALSSSRLAN